MTRINSTHGILMLAMSILTGCGGGGGSTPAPAPAPAPTPFTMSCVDGANYQCSGAAILRSENGVALTRSGVQVHGRSTGDVLNPANPNIATGLALASGGTAEIRSHRTGGNPDKVVLLLKNLGIRWDATSERPPIIELFDPTGPLNSLATSRVELGNSGALLYSTLPAPSDLAFYDFGTLGAGGTQANYANNRYFPRTDPARCDSPPCTQVETTGLNFTAGNWPSSGVRPNVLGGQRLHEDGDIHAGDAPGGGILPGGNGRGVPFPGSKGVREIVQWSYSYSNIGYWGTRDTVDLAEWSPIGSFEHNTARTGVVTYGAVTDPSTVPSTGSASYAGFVYGAYAPDGATDQVNFTGNVTVTVNFTARTVVVAVSNCVVAGTATPVPIAFASTSSISGTAGEENYASGTIAGGLNGGISNRFFGPLSSGNPPEVGGAFSLSGAGGAAAIGGYIAYR